MISTTMSRLLTGGAGTLALAACTASSAQLAPIENIGGGNCDAAPVQSYVGREATSPLGAAILEQSGAKSLRWGAPNSAWTMDFREDRVNVRYGQDTRITDITCG
ncbi:MAG: I78 family peptidase inhibitor [Erythrobacter sp.]